MVSKDEVWLRDKDDTDKRKKHAEAIFPTDASTVQSPSDDWHQNRHAAHLQCVKVTWARAKDERKKWLDDKKKKKRCEDAILLLTGGQGRYQRTD